MQLVNLAQQRSTASSRGAVLLTPAAIAGAWLYGDNGITNSK
jgi:hypothetical protein